MSGALDARALGLLTPCSEDAGVHPVGFAEGEQVLESEDFCPVFQQFDGVMG